MIRLAILALGLLASPAAAHSFYSTQCCNEKDCGPIADELVQATPQGWLYVPTGEVFAYGKDGRLRDSPDGKFHRCPFPAGNTRCLYTPGMGS